MTRPLVERFWEKVNVRGPDDCWEWRGAKNADGYGYIRDREKVLRANRVSWNIHNGEIPEGLQVLHKCDNRGCVNPTHFFLGTHQDNMADMNEKGRLVTSPGERHGKVKLTKAQVIEIRRRYAAGGVTLKHLGEEHGVVQSTAYFIVHGQTWAHVREGLE